MSTVGTQQYKEKRNRYKKQKAHIKTKIQKAYRKRAAYISPEQFRGEKKAMYDTYLSEQVAAQRTRETLAAVERRQQDRLVDSVTNRNRRNSQPSGRHMVRLGRLVVMW